MNRIILAALALVLASSAHAAPCYLTGIANGTPIILLDKGEKNADPNKPFCTGDEFAKYYPDEYSSVPRRDNVYRPLDMGWQWWPAPESNMEVYAPPLIKPQLRVDARHPSITIGEPSAQEPAQPAE
jgi:hypothetical protein